MRILSGLILSWIIFPLTAFGDMELSGGDYLREASKIYSQGMYFKAARYAFAAAESDRSLKPDAYAWITMGLIHAGMPNAASYFFIRTLQGGRHAAIVSVLSQTEDLLMSVGADLLRKYLIRHTKYEDYDIANRSAYLYALGKDALLSGDTARSVGYFEGIADQSPLKPFALQLKATAFAILGRDQEALRDFRSCAATASRVARLPGKDAIRRHHAEREAEDLESRCIAGEARTYYQMSRFDEAERVYDQIQKKSFVWPDILFEQAWNGFAIGSYNRALGKLVSYKSPALNYVFNSEVDVLRAQSYLALCLYGDANEAVNEFNSYYNRVGIELKRFVEGNSGNLAAFHDLGKQVLRSSLYSKNEFYRLTNRFVRGPYFQNLVSSEWQVARELEAAKRFDATQLGVEHTPGSGFPGFLDQVLRWRLKSIQMLGGAFVKNSLLDHYAALIEDFEKVAFIKLEMLKKSKDKILNKAVTEGDRSRGSVAPSRRDDQYQWSFNGEFWTDELGDYVFGLESECKG